jgi:NADH-quinone oxidoreductase subunit L
MISGSITALFMGFLGIVQNDVKRVVAYSTLSQLGYMTVALGASAYNAAMFHVMTHAFFKALLFLGAGSVIMGMHHDQDMRNMGGLRKYMPITWITSLIGSLALIGTPFFSGFYSKDSIIEAVGASHLPFAPYAYAALIIGVFVTAFYSFRMYFLVFHGKERWMEAGHDAHHDDHEDEEPSGDHHHGLGPNDKPHESPWVVTLPLVVLAIPSVLIGFFAIEPLLFGKFFEGAIRINEHLHPAMEELKGEFHGPVAMAVHALASLPFWLAAAGVATAWFFYMKAPQIPAAIKQRFSAVHTVLENKYYMDDLYFNLFAKGSRAIGTLFWKVGDMLLIDGLVVNGSAKLVGWFSSVVRRLQTGFIYSYAACMIIGVLALVTLWFWPLISH